MASWLLVPRIHTAVRVVLRAATLRSLRCVKTAQTNTAVRSEPVEDIVHNLQIRDIVGLVTQSHCESHLSACVSFIGQEIQGFKRLNCSCVPCSLSQLSFLQLALNPFPCKMLDAARGLNGPRLRVAKDAILHPGHVLLAPGRCATCSGRHWDPGFSGFFYWDPRPKEVELQSWRLIPELASAYSDVQ